MKKALFLLLVVFMSAPQLKAQFSNFGAMKKKKKVSAEEILTHVKKNEEKRAYKPSEIIPVYSEAERTAVISQIRKAKKVDDLPVLKTKVYYPNMEVFGLQPYYNEIKDERYLVWRTLEKLQEGETIKLYAIYDLQHSLESNEPGSLDELEKKPGRYSAVKITDDMNENTKFMHGSYFRNAMSHFGDGHIWYIYQGRRDTLLMREEYLKAQAQ